MDAVFHPAGRHWPLAEWQDVAMAAVGRPAGVGGGRGHGGRLGDPDPRRSVPAGRILQTGLQERVRNLDLFLRNRFFLLTGGLRL